ncbi:hypothetical protein [Nostoc sp. WHI]|uniref:hypothetical protein n=1 Tax=Nostoc sp. WHI TaxID=2650611 RepID=UPI0018C45AE6|nr:hypothetical protein [Nostoc sp. WHI]MBG1271105.1 hypothetical protein [Nostoc sp. WHI]
MTVKVTFCAQIREGNDFLCIAEDDLEAKFEDYREKLFSNTGNDGFIIISSPEQPDVQIQDELWAIIQNLCFIAIPDLIAHKSVVIRIYNNYGYVRLDPEADLVRISGDGLPDVRVTRAELITSLYACGKRFIQFLRKLGEDDPEYKDIIEGVEEHAKLAQQTLNEYKP